MKARITATHGGIQVGKEDYEDIETASFALVIASKIYQRRGFIARQWEGRNITLQKRTGEQVKLALTEVIE